MKMIFKSIHMWRISQKLIYFFTHQPDTTLHQRDIQLKMNANQQTHNDKDSSSVQSQKTYKFDPSQVFTQETLEDIRNRIGLTEHNMTTQQFARVLDDGMSVTLVLAVADDGFRYIKSSDDMDNCIWYVGGSGHTTDGAQYTIRYSELTTTIQSILIDHLNDGKLVRHSNTEFFLRYQMTLEDMDWNRRCVQLEVATASYNTVLPSRKQVLDLYHNMYVRPANAEDEEDDE